MTTDTDTSHIESSCDCCDASDYEQIMATHGWVFPPVVMDEDEVWDGYHRIAAAHATGTMIESVDIREIFAEAGLDYDELVMEHGPVDPREYRSLFLPYGYDPNDR